MHLRRRDRSHRRVENGRQTCAIAVAIVELEASVAPSQFERIQIYRPWSKRELVRARLVASFVACADERCRVRIRRLG